MVQRALGDSPALAEIPQYWDAYNRLVPIAIEFKLLKERDAYVHAGPMEGQHQLESTVTRGEYDPVAAITNMQQARWLLERAKTALEQRAPAGSDEAKRNASLGVSDRSPCSSPWSRSLRPGRRGSRLPVLQWGETYRHRSAGGRGRGTTLRPTGGRASAHRGRLSRAARRGREGVSP